MSGVDLPPEIQLQGGELLLRQAHSALESKWYLAFVLGTFLIMFGTDLLMGLVGLPRHEALRDGFPFSTYFAILPIAFLLLRLIWTSRYFLTNQRVMALSGPRWARQTLHEMPIDGCRAKWFSRFGLTVRSPQNGYLRLAYLGMTDANSFAYDINHLGQTSRDVPIFVTGKSSP